MSKEILILDEPTSDLDSHLALNLVVFLKKLAFTKGITVIMTIHQPSNQIFQCFDNLLFMSNGKVVYDGEADKLQEYLASKSIIKPDNWLISEFIFEAFYSESNFKEIQVLEPVINAFKEEIDIKSNSIVDSSVLSNKTPERYENQEISIKKGFYLFKRQFSKFIKSKTSILLFCICFHILSLIGAIYDYIYNAPDKIEIKEKLLEDLKDKLSEEFLKTLQPRLFLVYCLAISPLVSPFFIRIYMESVKILNAQIAKEIHKNFYSAKTFYISIFFSDFTMSTLLFATYAILAGIFGLLKYIPYYIWIFIFTFLLSNFLFIRFLTTLLNSSGLLAPLFAYMKLVIISLYNMIIFINPACGYLKIYYLKTHYVESIRASVEGKPLDTRRNKIILGLIRLILSYLTFLNPNSFLLGFYYMKFIFDNIKFLNNSDSPNMIWPLNLWHIKSPSSSVDQNILYVLTQLINTKCIYLLFNDEEEIKSLKNIFASFAFFTYFGYCTKYILLIGMIMSFLYLLHLSKNLFAKKFDPRISLNI